MRLGLSRMINSVQVEQKIIEIWEDVLRTPINDITLDFFMAGGDSLQAFQVIAQIQEYFDIDINIGDLFELATVHELTEYVIKQMS